MTIWWWLAQHLASLALLIAVASLVCRLIPNRPALQHVLWLVILIKFLMPPWILWPVSANALINPLAIQWSAEDRRLPPESASSIKRDFRRAETPPLSAELIPGAPDRIGEHPAPIVSALPASQSRSLGWAADFKLSRLLFVIWFVGSSVFAFRQYRRMRAYAGLVRRADAAPDYLRAEVSRLSGMLRVRPTAVLVTAEISSPFVWCLGRRKVLWPMQLADEVSLGRWQGVLAHELAHIRRRDHWTAWLELAVGVVWWWNPLFWFARRWLRESAEIACDALVLSVLPDERRAYAEAFLELSTAPLLHPAAPALGIGSHRHKFFEKRLSMILSSRLISSVSLPGLLVATLFASLAFPGLSLGQAETSAEGNTAEPSTLPAAQSTGEKSEHSRSTQPRAIETFVDSISEIVIQNRTITRAEIVDPETATATMMSDQKVRIVGKKIGTTKLRLWSAEDTQTAVQTFEVVVRSGAILPASNGVPLQQANATTPSIKPTAAYAETGSAEQLDLTGLGIAIIDARGEVELAKYRYQGLSEANNVTRGAVTHLDLKAAEIKVETARRKLAFLTRIAQSAYDSAKSELDHRQVLADRTKTLAARHSATAEQVDGAARAVQAAKSKLKLVQLLLEPNSPEQTTTDEK